MAWCPICKKDYEDINICPDCSVELLNGKAENYADILAFPNEEISLKIYNHLMELDFETVQYYYKNSEKMYHIVCELYEASDVRREILAYIANDMDVSLTSSEKASLKKLTDKVISAELAEAGQSKTYVSAKDKYADIHSSAYSLLIVGAIGLILLILDITGIYRFPFAGVSRIIFLVTMGALFILFFTMGIWSFKKARQISDKIGEEDSLETSIKNFITGKLDINAIESSIDEELSDEEKYLIRTSRISEALKNEFPDAEEAFIDHMIEVTYDDIF